MTEREKLELAAKALGWVSWDWLANNGTLNVYDAEGRHESFAPDTDQADSDWVACKLRIDRQIITSTAVTCIKLGSPNQGIHKKLLHNNTDEDVCRAVREARMAVAVEIGRAMK